MNRYQILKRMRKLLSRLSAYLEGTVMPESQIRNIINELDGLIKISEAGNKSGLVPNNVISRVNFFLEAFKHHFGIEKSTDPNVMGIEDMNTQSM